MTRTKRNFNTHDRFHIINHGVDGQDLFSIDEDWCLFEALLRQACENFSFSINAFALMSNHYHVLLDLSDCDDRARISDAIGVAQSTYSKYFNGRTGRRGPLFEPRFLGFGVDGDTKTHRVIRYIHRNPIDICGPRALGNYRWSSLPVYLGRRPTPPWLEVELFRPQRPLDHLAELADVRVEDLSPLYSLPPQRRVSLDSIDTAVSHFELPGSQRQSIVFLLALELRAADIVQISARFDCSESKVRKAAQRARLERTDDPAVARLLDRIIARLAMST